MLPGWPAGGLPPESDQNRPNPKPDSPRPRLAATYTPTVSESIGSLAASVATVWESFNVVPSVR